jgi:hypothetical protein
MQLEGTIHNGVVVFETETPLPEGTRVTVTPCDPASSGPTHYDLFRDVIGQAVGLPEDMALNHNHYIRGGPKQ